LERKKTAYKRWKEKKQHTSVGKKKRTQEKKNIIGWKEKNSTKGMKREK
jgi:hypothetical protein